MRGAVLVLRLALVLVGDLVMIKSTFDHVLRLQSAFSWALAVAMTLLAVPLAWMAGTQTRMALAHEGWVMAATLLAMAWAVAGAALFYLRYHAAELTQQVTGFEGSVVDGDAEQMKERLLAWVLLALFVATGVLAFFEGFTTTNPAAAQLHRLNVLVPDLARRVAEQQGLVTRLVDSRATHAHQLATVAERRAEARRAAEALAAEMKAHARVQLALALGNPSASEVVHDAHGSCPPARPAGAAAPRYNEDGQDGESR
jgi:hypothetical protein